MPPWAQDRAEAENSVFYALLLTFARFGRLLSPSDIQTAQSWAFAQNYTFILE